MNYSAKDHAGFTSLLQDVVTEEDVEDEGFEDTGLYLTIWATGNVLWLITCHHQFIQHYYNPPLSKLHTGPFGPVSPITAAAPD